MFDRAAARRGSPADLLVVGLGNPGAQYVGTRHNIGFEVIDHLVEQSGLRLKMVAKVRAMVAEARIGDHSVVLASPQTFMNLSGESVSRMVVRFGIVEPERIVVIHDEIDLPVGALRIKCGGGSAGNNGIRSIDAHLGTPDYVRIRVGVGRPPNSKGGKVHVLKPPGKSERVALDTSIAFAADAVETYLLHGLDETMNRFNRRTTE